MINIVDVQAAIVAMLKTMTPPAGVPAITSVVASNEIRELQWQGHDFLYPNIRVSVASEVPIGRDDCREDNSTIVFYIYAFVEKDSSLDCRNILSVVKSNIGNKQIIPNPITFRSGPIHTQRIVEPIRASERVWRGQGIFEVNIYKQ